jgi:pyridoxine 4-dehydrogenase
MESKKTSAKSAHTVAAEAGEFSFGDDLRVTRLGFGAMRITGDGVWGEPKDRAEAARVLRRAVELGVQFIDTADSYGPNVSEEIIAEALYPYPKGLVIATKGGFDRPGPNRWVENGRPEHLRSACEGSLRRLRLERIDLYQLHRIDSKVPAEAQLGTLKELQAEGKIRHIGLSEVSVRQIQQARTIVPIVCVQNRYSITDRGSEDALEYCEREKLGFIPWFPLAAGKVSGASWRNQFLLSVDDDSDVLRAIERDLRSQYGAEYRVIGSDSPRERSTAEAVEGAQRQRGPAAGRSAHAAHGRRRISAGGDADFPDAKRALLTAYADTNAAISAINQASINYFFLKPWDPPASTSIRNWTTCSTTGRLPIGRHSRESGCWARAGRRARTNCAIFLARNHVFPTSGSTLSFPPMTRKQSAAGSPGAGGEQPSGRAVSGRNQASESVPAEVAQKVGCERARKPIFTIWRLSAEARRVWPRRSMARPKACTP